MTERYKTGRISGFILSLILLLLLISVGYTQKLSYDYGDAPDKPYPTLNINNGARHLINYSVYLGNKIDADGDGQPNSGANGDDNDGTDDEDGVSFTSKLVPGKTANIVVKASISGMLSAWINFNGDSDWNDTGEEIFTDKALSSGNNSLSFSVPGGAKIGYTYARFRFSINGKLRYSGSAPDGEVEDYRIKIEKLVEYDFGDAPDEPYPTKLSSTGARHIINPDVLLGIRIDGEADGLSSFDAEGDDSNGLDDEDGVLFSSTLTAGAWATADVTASVSGFLNAWIDFNNDGDWADTGEQIFNDQSLSGGVNTVSFIVPGGSKIGSTFARFRFSTVNGLSYIGDANDGEVEDYQVEIRERGAPVPPVEIDVFELTLSEFELVFPDGSSEVILLTGPVTQAVYFEDTVEGSADDDDTDGLEEVQTELLDLDLTGFSPLVGPVHAGLNSALSSLGQIEETANTTSGVLDVAPFNTGGTAESFFDVFFEISFGGMTFYTVDPKHFSAVITHKPPGPGEYYEDCELIELMDAAGNPTGYHIRCADFYPTPPVEIDVFDLTLSDFELVFPDGSSEVVVLTGPVEQAVYFEGTVEGSADDDDTDGLEEVQTELLDLDLTGFSPLVGPVHAVLNSGISSRGEIEETANSTSGLLDVAPFTLGGTANSFFDVFFEISIGGMTFYTSDPKRFSGVITHKPPGSGDYYEDCELIELEDADGNPTGYHIRCADFYPSPLVELDMFPFSLSEFELVLPDGSSEVIVLTGPVEQAVYFEGTVEGSADDDDTDGLEEVQTELLDLDLTGFSPLVGPVHAVLNSGFSSLGQIEETANSTSGVLDVAPFTAGGTADSFFDVFFEISIGGMTFYTVDPKRFSAVITHKPPGPGEYYEDCEPVELMDAAGNPTGYHIRCADIRLRPPIEIDVFELSWSEFELVLPDGSSETVLLTGPVEQAVYFEGLVEGSAFDDDGDGQEEVSTEIVSMNLTGSSSTLGIVHASLNTEIVSFGQIEETINRTAGVLDVAPFTPEGTADSFFDVFFDITIDGTSYLTMVPKRFRSVITHKPPGPGEHYEDCERIGLEDADGNPTGYFIRCIDLRPIPEYDFGDAPDPEYPTLRINNGPYHIVTGRLHLGSSNDAEMNGQQDPNALGDDNDGNDDEDGVVFSAALIPGTSVNFNVTANNSLSVNAYFNAWIDYNGNSDWSDPGEHVFIDQVLASGSHTLTLNVPATAVPGLTFARFRYSVMDSLSFTGYGGIGEVEDYEVAILERETYPLKWSQPPTYYSDSPYPESFWGWDEVSVYTSHIVADDWCCQDSTPITDIHWWGSYLHWDKDKAPSNAPESFHIGIWNDVPKDVDGEFSHPGELIWEWKVKRSELNEKIAGSDFHPDFMEKPDSCFRYDFFIPDKDLFYQKGDSTIYWISIAAVYKEMPKEYVWGWKTREHYYNDDAVRIFSPGDPVIGSKFEKGEPIKDPKGNSWDMAFELTTIETEGKHDLGDAPDRSNTFSSSMTAYPGVLANFPTVYATGSPPYGPIHWNPKDIAFLGENVTLENEADTGLDEDPTNNINPQNNKPDLDLADDGVKVPLYLPHCQFTTFNYTVTVVNPTSHVFTVNAWFDWNRDGDWNDTLTCNDQKVYEWVVPNLVIVVNKSGTFTHKTNKFLCWHPEGEKDTSAVWMRITLSDKHWDPKKNIIGGTGPSEGWDYGETEDYYFIPIQEEIGYEYGDAPEGALAYPSLNLTGSFPTCKDVGPAGYIEHGNRGWTFFGYSVDYETDGNGGLCPTFNPDLYNQDETAGDGDCGIDVKAYTIQGPVGSETVVPIIPSYAGALGDACKMAVWGSNINLWWDTGIPDGAYINILFDWTQDGKWGGKESCPGSPPQSAPEHVLVNYHVPNGNGYLSALSPPSFRIGPKTGYIWARFTITERPVNLPWDGSGIFEDGETEDHLVLIGDVGDLFDFGDAPDTLIGSGFLYPTRFIDDGARHKIDKSVLLGSKIDPDPDGQPESSAEGDDNDGSNDEDGVQFATALVPGQTTTVLVTASVPGVFSGWVDFNGDGDWADVAEQVFNNQNLSSGLNSLSLSIPNTAALGFTFARFRFSTDSIATYTGEAKDGEVEDYKVEIIKGKKRPRKWSQPPTRKKDSPFPNSFWGWDEVSVYSKQIISDDWLCTDDRPVTDVHWWGSYKGWSHDKPPSNAPKSFHIGIWKDVPAGVDKDWSHPGELLWEWIADRSLVNEKIVGSDYYPFVMDKPDSCFAYEFIIPEDEWFYQKGDSTIYWISISANYKGVPDEYRWGWKTRTHYYNDDAVRIFKPGTPTVGSLFESGEPIKDLEGNSWDMAFELTTNEYLEEFDFGDAPDSPYPTLRANNGAYHSIKATLYLGKLVDPETDGQPDPNALGDDLLDGSDDEDGVVFNSTLAPDSIVIITVTASDSGYLNAWMDFNNNGDWGDPSEQIFVDYVLIPGSNNLSFKVPDSALTDTTFARFRFSSEDSLSYTGFAPDGEVEDYMVVVHKTRVKDRSSYDLLPSDYELSQNFPNPFNAFTEIRYGLPRAVRVRIVINNLKGQETVVLVDEQKEAGRYLVRWDGKDQRGRTVPTGIYLYRIEASGFTETKKMLMLK